MPENESAEIQGVEHAPDTRSLTIVWLNLGGLFFCGLFQFDLYVFGCGATLFRIHIQVRGLTSVR